MNQITKACDNFLMNTDGYKVGHYLMYPKNTETIYSYFESRKGSKFDATLFYGLQIILQQLEGQLVTQWKIEQAQSYIDRYLGPGVFNRAGWEYVLLKHDGKLPIRIKAVDEGTVVPTGNVLLTVENTDPKCPWLTNYVETWLTHVWYSTTVATVSRAVRTLLEDWLDKTSCLENYDSVLPYMLHDFGARAVTCAEQAAIGGSAHLLSFRGTDTVTALRVPTECYGMPADYTAGVSVFATEHSVMTARGEEGEFDIVRHLYDTLPPENIVSIVIDSYDYKRFLRTLGTEFKDTIMGRPGRTVFRPDSGDIVETSQECLRILGECFADGVEVNAKGYKILPDKVRVLWGDGIDIDGIDTILKASAENGWAAENWVFGMGGGLLQKVNRDTCRNAFKCSATYYDGAWHDVQKRPLDASKASKAGRLVLCLDEDTSCSTITTKRYEDATTPDLLHTVFENGVCTRPQHFDAIIRRSNSGMGGKVHVINK